MALNPVPADDDLEEERRLVESAKAGNLDAMRPIFDKYAGPLYSAVIMPKLGDPAAAEDVLRDTMSTAIQKLDQFSFTGTSIFPWLRQIAVNKAYDVHRSRQRGRKLAVAMTHEAEAQARHEPGADAHLMAAEAREESRVRIDEALAKISERYQLAIRLRLIEELPREVCAERMQVTVSTFDVVFFRATRAFRKHYGEREQ